MSKDSVKKVDVIVRRSLCMQLCETILMNIVISFKHFIILKKYFLNYYFVHNKNEVKFKAPRQATEALISELEEL